MQIITHRVHYFMLYRSLIARRRIWCLLEILFVFNRSLPSLFRFTLCRLITVLVRFHHHVFVGFNLVYLIFLKDLFLVIPICNVVGIVAVTHSVLMVSVLNHWWFIHKHYMAVWIIYIWEEIWAIRFKRHNLLIVKEWILVKIWAVEAFWLFIRNVISGCRLIIPITRYWASMHIVRCLLIHKIMIFGIFWRVWFVGTERFYIIMLMILHLRRPIVIIIVNLWDINLVLIRVRVILSTIFNLIVWIGVMISYLWINSIINTCPIITIISFVWSNSTSTWEWARRC